jgi:hypothetical protein
MPPIHHAARNARSALHDGVGIVGIAAHDGEWAEAHPCGTAPRID